MALKDEILSYLEKYGPTSDSKLASALHTTHQHVNQIARRLAQSGAITRDKSADAILNSLAKGGPPVFKRPRYNSPTQRVIEALKLGPATDGELAGRLGLPPQQVYQITTSLSTRGIADKGGHGSAARTQLREIADPTTTDVPNRTISQAHIARELEVSSMVTEDEVKQAIKHHLEASGWTVEIAWGRNRGIDIDAHRNGERLILEAKGEALSQPQQTNYFLGAMGELVQRASDPRAQYGLALPDNRVFRGLVDRLPQRSRQLLIQVVFFVARSGNGFAIDVDPIEST